MIDPVGCLIGLLAALLMGAVWFSVWLVIKDDGED